MATKGTIESEKFNILFKKYDNHKTYLYSCIGLADIIEKADDKEISKYLETHIGKYKEKVKNVVLGCTHYPLIQEQIDKVLGGNIQFFNGAERLAVHLKDILSEKGLLNEEINTENCEDKIEFIDSQNLLEKEKRFFKKLEN